ncbi:hypothetical protein X943_000969 [Babesia divergens]|uniref:Transporter n=1 Tax=Babesia divergens TaxID=32595 RepID=A0AAD9GF57_BABDI|nr:hypothetical protein X943_000969 [Babesia divergens]
MNIGWVWRLYIYGTISVLIGPFYDNWISMEKYLYLVGAYSNLCPDGASSAPATTTWRCKKQRESVTMLLTVARTSECTFSVLIGIFMDRVGPKITSVVGVALRVTGWTLIGYMVHVNYAIIAAFVLMGLSVNFIVFPALTIGLYTKEFRFVAIVQIGMCSCFSSLIIMLKVVILEGGFLTSGQINYLYSIVCLLPCLVLCVVFFPLRLKSDLETNDLVLHAHAVRTSHCSITTNVPVASDPVGELPSHAEADATAWTMELDPIKDTTEIYTKDEISNVIGDTTSLKCYYDGLRRTLRSREVITCLFYFAYNFGSITFVQQSYSLMYRDDPSLLTLTEYLVPLAFIPCLVFSALYMCVKPIWIMLSINVLGALMHIVATVRGRFAGALLSIMLVTVYSVLNTKVYNYLDTVFDETYIGSIVGVLNSTCGIWLLLQGLVLQGLNSPQELDITNYAMSMVRICFVLPFLYLAFVVKASKSAPDGVNLKPDERSQGKDADAAATLVA